MSDEDILRRLDKMQATLQLAFAPQLEAARTAIREDDVAAEILDATESWIGSRDLQKRVAAKTDVGERSVRDRFTGLIECGILETRGTERKAEFRRTGLI